MSVVPMNERPTKLIQLPNGDLWRGMPEGQDQARPDTVDASAPATSEDAVAEAFTKQKGETVHCNWCGVEFSKKQFNEFSEHIAKLHPTALKPLEPVAAKELFDLSNAVVVGRVESDVKI